MILLFREEKSPLLHEHQQIIVRLSSVVLLISQIIFQNAFGLKCISWGGVLPAVPWWFPQGWPRSTKAEFLFQVRYLPVGWRIGGWSLSFSLGLWALQSHGCACAYTDRPWSLIEERQTPLTVSFFWFLLFHTRCPSAQLIQQKLNAVWKLRNTKVSFP